MYRLATIHSVTEKQTEDRRQYVNNRS